ncbi:MAG: MFS transporter [Gammaproteobacteria bacterium]|nr:MFS transporter [Gammaproteobacteria bacterium]
MRVIWRGFLKRYRHQPQGFYLLLYTEMSQLFGQFSITALLVLYMTSQLKADDVEAFRSFGAFSVFIYAIPILGGYIADRLCGLKTAIIFGMLMMILGSFLLTFAHLAALYLGLSVFSVGFGFFIPSITSLLGQLYPLNDPHRDKGFMLYYIAKNLGALLATLAGSFIAIHEGYSRVYWVSSAVMVSGLIVFLWGSPQLTSLFAQKAQVWRKNIPIALAFSAVGCVGMAEIIFWKGWIDFFVAGMVIFGLGFLLQMYLRFEPENRRRLLWILLAIALAMIFGGFLAQSGTTQNLFIQRLVDRHLAGVTLPTSFFYALDPFFMLLIGPLVMAILVRHIRGREFISVALTKMNIGLCVLGVGFLIFAIGAQAVSHSGHESSMGYVIFSYALSPIAELSMMPVVIAFVTRLAPQGYEASLIGVYMLGIAISSGLTVFISKLGRVGFSMSNVHAKVQAAQIYQHVFLISSMSLLALGACGIGLVLLRHNRMMKRNGGYG